MANYKKKAANAVLLADKMRKSILQAAIEGKLTTQNSAKDGDARDLLAEIQAEKQQLIAAGKIKREKALPAIDESDLPFDIPDNWVWVRLGDLCLKVGSGSTPLGGKAVYVNEGVKFIRSQNVHNHGLVLENVAFIKEETHKNKLGSEVHAKDVLLNITGASIGRAAIVPDDFDKANINQHVLILRLLNFDLRYFFHVTLISPYIFQTIMGVQVGGTKEGLSAAKAKELLIPLPPLAEQQRIVEKLEQILPQLDRLQADENKLHAMQTAFPSRMQASLLQAAIEGKLTTQDPKADGTASDLLKQIQAEKQRLIDAKEIKREKPLPAITDEEKPFDIPNNWEWVRIGDIVNFINGRAYKAEELLTHGKYKVLRVGNFFSNDKWYYSDLELEDNKYCHKGDLLYAWSASFGPRIWTEYDTIFHYHIWKIEYGILNREFLYYLLLADIKNIQSDLTGSTMKHLSLTNMLPRLVPLPPLAEQERIVAKLDALLPKVQALNNL